MLDIKKVNMLWSVFCVAIILVTACSSQAAVAPTVASPSATPNSAPTAQPTNTSFPQVDAIPVQPEIPSLYESQAAYFPIGAALMSDQLDDGRHIYLLTRHFNALTPENEMKPVSIQPSEGVFTWEGADGLMRFAQAHNMVVHGHTLVWHSQVPDWMFQDAQGQPLTASPESKTLVLSRMETHIRALVGRYKGQIAIWDVVNEVIDPGYPDCMRRSKWYELTGADYISLAFNLAHEVDPNARLLINDYGTEDPSRQACLYNLIRDLRAQGVPVDGIGHQMHINVESPSVAAIEQTLQKFDELGVEQYVTELDMSLYTNNSASYSKVPSEVMIQQGHRYKEIFDVFKRHAKTLKGVTFWGMADDHTWLKTWPIARINLPLLFDEKLQAKYAYWGIVDPTYPRLPMLIQKISISKGTPELDGQAELLWSQQPWNTLRDLPQASFQVRWDEKNLYVFVNIKGDPQHIQKIEVFVDENKNKTKTYEADDRHYSFENGVCSGCEGVKSAAAVDGYQLEAAIPLNLGAGRGGQKIGFDLRITTNDQPQPISWNDHTNQQDADTSQYGTLTLAPAAQLIAATQGTPVVDGEADEVWDKAVEFTTSVWVLSNTGATAKVKLLWDSECLYIFAMVTDPKLSDASRNAWEQDSIEVFIDQNNAKTSTYEPDDGQFRVNFKNVQTYNGDAKAELITSATKEIPGGYVVELAIKFDAIQPQEGMLIGFDFQVNDDANGDGARDSVVVWNDPTGQSYINTSRLGLLQFVKQASK
jgi:endo-1,4-beta-xylanase